MNRNDARMPKTIPRLLQIRAEESPSKTFLYYKDAEISYSRLDEIANSIANGLREDTGIEEAPIGFRAPAPQEDQKWTTL